jgi:hypothetical protein
MKVVRPSPDRIVTAGGSKTRTHCGLAQCPDYCPATRSGGPNPLSKRNSFIHAAGVLSGASPDGHATAQPAGTLVKRHWEARCDIRFLDLVYRDVAHHTGGFRTARLELSGDSPLNASHSNAPAAHERKREKSARTTFS